MRFAILAAILTLLVATAAGIDQWGLAGHGVSRSLFNGSSTDQAWKATLSAPDADSCFFPAFSTPFSWWDMAAGAILSPNGTLYATLYCGKDYTASLWAVDATTGAQNAFQGYRGNITTWDSYLRQIADGHLAAGTSTSVVTLFDPDTLDITLTTAGLVQGDGGAMVVSVFAEVNGKTQITSAGGNGGSDWWGASCDVHPGPVINNCIETADSTSCIGADGVTAYNNQRFENPNGAVRFDLPFPANPIPYNSNYVQWPWWIRSDLSGNAYVYDGQFLTKFSPKQKQLWQISDQYNWLGLMLTDDESVIALSNQTYLTTVNPANGKVIATVGFEESFGRDITCGAVFSPWMNGLPVPLADSMHAIVVCGTTVDTAFLSVINLQGGKDGRQITVGKKVSLTVPPSQIVVDNVGNLYSFGYVSKTPTIQKVLYAN